MKDLAVGRLIRGGKLFFGAGAFAAVVILLSFLSQPLAAQTAQNIAGTWQGTLPVNQGGRIVLKISKAGSGGWQGVFLSLDSGMGSGRTTTAMTLQGSSIEFTIAPIDGSYEGKLSDDGASIAGTWTQSKQPRPLNFVRATPDTAWAIPESDKPMPPDDDPAYDVVTIKPSDPNYRSQGFQTRGRHLLAANETVNAMISFAYGIHVKQIVGGPAWFSTDHYLVDGVADAAGEPNLNQFRSMIRKLLADRFDLKVHTDKRNLSVYALTVENGGPKLTKSLGNPNGPPDDTFSTSAWMRETNTTMGEFAKAMQYVVDRPVVDQTGLAGRWDFLLKWTPDESQFTSMGVKIQAAGDDPNAPPPLFTAIQEQLGLKMEPVKAPVDVLVIDHVERPTEN